MESGLVWVATNAGDVVPRRIDTLLTSGFQQHRKGLMRAWSAGPPQRLKTSTGPLRPAKTISAKITEHQAQAPVAPMPLADGGTKIPPLTPDFGALVSLAPPAEETTDIAPPGSACKVPAAAHQDPTPGLLTRVSQQPDASRRYLQRGLLAGLCLDSPRTDAELKDSVKCVSSDSRANVESRPLLGRDHSPSMTSEAQRRSLRHWEARDVQEEMHDLITSLGAEPAEWHQQDRPVEPPAAEPQEPFAALGTAPASGDAMATESGPLPPPPRRTLAHYLTTPDDDGAQRYGHSSAMSEHTASLDVPAACQRGVSPGREILYVQREVHVLSQSPADIDAPPGREPSTELPRAAKAAESKPKLPRVRRNSVRYLITPADAEQAQQRGFPH